MANIFTTKLPISVTKLNDLDQRTLRGLLNSLNYETGDSMNDLLFAFNQFKKNEKLTYPGELGNLTVQILLSRIEDSLDDTEIENNIDPKIPLLEKELIIPSQIDWTNNNCPISKYFIVGEVTKYSRDRIPTSETIQKNILKIALELDKVREFLQKPIIVTSWYRPPAVNRLVSKATQSQHLYGKAVDIQCKGMATIELEKILLKNWYGAVGKAAAKLGFVHLDDRNGKGWRTGGEKGIRFPY